MKKFTLCLVLFINISAAFSQTPCIPTFQKKYSGSKNDISLMMISNVDNSITLAGYTNSFGNGGYDGLLQRMDRAGNILWSRAIGGAADEQFTAAKQTTDGGFIAVGFSKSYGGGSNGVAWMVKTDGNGIVQWSRKYDNGNPSGSIAWDVVLTSDGGYALTGTNNFAPALADAMVIKTDNNGVVQWAKNFDSGNTDQSLGIVEDADSLIVTANHYGQSSSLYDAVVMKLNRTNGNTFWAKDFEIENKSNWPRKISRTSTGYSFEVYNDVAFSSVSPETIVINTDKNGNPLSVRKIGDVVSRGPVAYTATSDGGFVMLQSEANSTTADIHMLKVGNTGILEWSRRFGGAGLQQGTHITQAADGGFLLGAYISSTGAIPDSNDIYVIKTDATGNTPGCTVPNSVATIVNTPYTFNGNFIWASITNITFVASAVTTSGLAVNQATTSFCASCISLGDTIVNNYTPALSFDICKNAIIVEDGAKYKIGDTVLVIQMKGAVIDSSNTAAFGRVTDYKNAGNYEFNYVKGKNGNIIELKNVPLRQYDYANGKVQLIRVPFYQKLNMPYTLTCQPWNGTSGGVLAINVADSLNLAANIDVSGKGFKSTPVDNHVAACHELQYFYNSNSANAGFKGEGIFDLSNNNIKGMGKAANAGGGGNGNNAGGGGGANFGSGGIGGKEAVCNAQPQSDNGGIGGEALTYTTALNKIFLGGSGGNGDQNDNSGSAGGNGGGIVIITAGVLKSNGYQVQAKGATPASCTGANCADGQGGGGGGGTAVLNITNFADNIIVNTSGGNGGSYSNTGAAAYYGPGGGGGGGALFVKSATLPAAITYIKDGGFNGTWTNTSQTGNALGGSTGGTLFNAVLPVAGTLYKSTFDSAKFNIEVTNCTALKFIGLANINNAQVVKWRWNFGDGGTDSVQTVSHNYLLPGTYTVKVVATDVYGCVANYAIDITIFCRCEAIKLISANPTKDFITINGLGCGYNTITVYNMLGQKLQQVTSDKPVERLDVHTLSRGLYMVRIINAKGVLSTLKIEKM